MNKRRPTFRDGAKDALRDWVRDWAEAYTADLIKTCLTCVDFREHERNDANERHPAEWCMKYNERPPARVIAYGCNSYCHDDEIPF